MAELNWKNHAGRRAISVQVTVFGKFCRVSENFVFRSGRAKIFPKALSHSIFRADRKYGLEFAIRPQKDREKLKLRFYPYRIS